MTLSTMGKAVSSSLTSENSCSGPKTSNALYVAVPLFVQFCLECDYSAQLILNMTVAISTFQLSGVP